MSKLDDTLAKAYEFVTQEAWTEGAKQAIKDLMLELIEQSTSRGDKVHYRTLRQKVEEL